jgi:hypothetical protein
MPGMSDGVPTPEVLEQKPEQGGEPANEELSSVEADEFAYEHSAERMDNILHAEEAPRSQVRVKKQIPVPLTAAVTKAVQKDPIVIEVEKILEEGVGSFYGAMPDEAKAEFKRKGEETAFEISEMIRTFQVKFKRLIRLISEWLKTIPGVNKFFLEQEAKIKADRIIQLMEARKHERDQNV